MPITPGHSPSFLCASTKRRGGLRQSRKTGQFVIPRSRGIQSAKPTCVIFAFITQVDAKRQLDPGLRRDDGASRRIPPRGEGDHRRWWRGLFYYRPGHKPLGSQKHIINSIKKSNIVVRILGRNIITNQDFIIVNFHIIKIT